jgi:N-glycosylase/DNA lyase
MRSSVISQTFPVRNYDLDSTLASGQSFRWRHSGGTWSGVVGRHWVRMTATAGAITAESGDLVADWAWLSRYLQIETDLDAVLRTFPGDEPMIRAVAACRGLRLLRQDPWETLASFILSSTKQIVQIQQIIGLLCQRYGEPIDVPPGEPPHFSFPAASRLAGLNEPALRDCKMGFRAPYLLATARRIADGGFDLERIGGLPVEAAREQLMSLPGVGAKIADCVLLFAYGFQNAFPVDVWVMRALRRLYFPRRRPSPKRLRHFTNTHFGCHAGYAQQYLFHYVRTQQPHDAHER